MRLAAISVDPIAEPMVSAGKMSACSARMFALHMPKPNVARDTHMIASAALGALTTRRPPSIASAPSTITVLRANVALRPRASSA